MKLFSASLALAVSVATADEGLTYTPNNDVTSHSKVALDQLDIKALIDAETPDIAGAIDIYTNGSNREGSSLQGMARKDWVAAGVEDVSEYDAYAALFNQGDGEPFLDSFNLDAMHCNGTFAGQTADMCAIAAKKNLLCTGLQYAQYEGVKAIQFGNEKNWDELFAFWNGVYDPAVDTRVDSGGPGAVQKSRDSDFETSFREDAIQALIDGQKAFSKDGVDKKKLTEAYDDFKKANLATFAQATLKYSALFDEAGLEQAKIDKKWGEGYTYFRCGAGLMDPELALYINYVLDPRDKKDMTLTPKETHCKIVNKMLSLPEIGMGVKMSDLSIETYLTTIKEDCGLDKIEHAKGPNSSKNERIYIPFIGFLVVVGLYAAGFLMTRKKSEDEL
mmetsp:Transcript_1001/g.1487  ORF Transcript_1001/g.1487 Transcript_1001/m.1487 type:complete len:390 (+) Transcript_1001:74-1243(+)